MMLRHVCCGVRRRVRATNWMPLPRLSWVSGTILGFLVVPDVCSTSARSSAAVAAMLGGEVTVGPLIVKRPTVSVEGVSSITGTPAFLQHSLTAAALSSPTWTIIAAAGRSVSSNSISGTVSAGLSGAKTHRPVSAQKQTAASGPLGIAVQITMSRESPYCARSIDAANSLSWLKVRGFLPGSA